MIDPSELADLRRRRDELDQQIADIEYAAACAGKSALDLPMQENDANAATVRDYLKGLLLGVWEKGESFDGKRPFGNSGWEYDLYRPLVVAGLVPGNVGVNAFGKEFDRDAADRIICEAIEAL
ncbi:hypothetical protein [Azospirillum sp. B506]|uniref:hypothetical protein n=1 Tax=Azospirillum sp. B506 TaxID=137721 RepID=UPI00034B1FB0|nr:hypothetical protein [Azospirillum sp. B506]